MENDSQPTLSPRFAFAALDALFSAQRPLPAGRQALLASLALALGVLGDVLFNGAGTGLNVPLWTVALVIAAVLVRRGKAPMALRERALLGVTVLLSLMVAWRASPSLQAINIAASATCLTLALAMQPQQSFRRIGFLAFAYALLCGAMSDLVGAWHVASGRAWRERFSGATRTTVVVGRALLITAPVIFAFGGLFVAADAVFERQLTLLAETDLTAIQRHLLGTFAVTWIACGVLWASVAVKVDEVPAFDLPEDSRLGLLETGTALGALALLFAVFVAIQLRYLFGGENLVQESINLSYAQYARRGFFELVITTALLLPVLLAVHWACRRSKPVTLAFRGLAVVLILLLAVVMASALRRLQIYVDAYGLTELRFYALSVLFLLAAAFVWFIGSVLRDHRDEFLAGALIVLLVAIIAINLADPDGIIAATNTQRLNSGRSFDASHALSLSDDAIPTLVERIARIPLADRCRVATALLERSDESPDPRSWTLGHRRATHAVEANRVTLQAACLVG